MVDIRIISTGSEGNCYLLTNGEGRLLIEAGLPARQIYKALDHRVASLDGVLISHAHGDHIVGAKELAKRGVDLYMSKGTADDAGLTGHRIVHVEPSKTVVIKKRWAVVPFDAVHDGTQPLCFLIGTPKGDRILYASDTALIRAKFDGLTHIMIECNYREDLITDCPYRSRLFTTHMSVRGCIRFLNSIDKTTVKKVYLIHGSKENLNAMDAIEQVMDQTGFTRDQIVTKESPRKYKRLT